MWKAAVGHNVSVTDNAGGDDWETDPDFVNDISEEEQRWGAKTIQGSGRPQHIDINQLRSSVSKEHEQLKKKELQDSPKASYGYGGQFGTEKDRMDKSALGHEYKAEVEMHSSQTDAAKGFGGKYGVQKERCDKSAVGFDYKAQIQQHSSQQDHSKGFGGRYGVQTDRVDKSAAGFGEIESPSSAYEKTQPLEAMTSGAQNLRSRFENMAKTAEQENRQKAEEERERRQKKDKLEREGNRKKETPQMSEFEQPQNESVPVPIPTPRVFPVSPQITKEEMDPDCDSPPAVPPKLPAAMVVIESPPNEMSDEEQTYEDIAVPPHVTEDLYEAIPDPPPRFQEEDSEDYETILEPPAGINEDFYEELPKDDEVHEQVPSTHIDQSRAAGISAIALYDYEGGGNDEISFEPQDIITDIEMLDEGWWTGSCRGQRGLFPANYVELVE
ncbi:hematopoietic lineage cell-specific protein-like isoform X2 [Mixophyes fleayi]|uniref:hematopoietic lineage cell-specific protein-like isoform X2 n=1 Tax=Mixophyes fleayi TaxID=3061075 RepID=UPI003F4E3C2C